MKSIKLTLILLLIFALSQAIGTFIENDYGIETSWALIYRATWFEILQVLLALNLFINTINFKMYTLKKLPILTFHLAFIIILIGSGITRYAGFEGKMNIQEGFTENRMLSSESFLQTKVTKNNNEYYDEKSDLVGTETNQDKINQNLLVDKILKRNELKELILGIQIAYQLCS